MRAPDRFVVVARDAATLDSVLGKAITEGKAAVASVQRISKARDFIEMHRARRRRFDERLDALIAKTPLLEAQAEAALTLHEQQLTREMEDLQAMEDEVRDLAGGNGQGG